MVTPRVPDAFYRWLEEEEKQRNERNKEFKTPSKRDNSANNSDRVVITIDEDETDEESEPDVMTPSRDSEPMATHSAYGATPQRLNGTGPPVGVFTPYRKRESNFGSQQSPRKQQKHRDAVSPTTEYADEIVVANSPVQSHDTVLESPQQSRSPSPPTSLPIEAPQPSEPQSEDPVQNPVSFTGPATGTHPEEGSERETEETRPTPQQAYISWLEEEQNLVVTRLRNNRRELVVLSEKHLRDINEHKELSPQQKLSKKIVLAALKVVEEARPEAAEYESLMKQLNAITLRYRNICPEQLQEFVNACQRERDEHAKTMVKAENYLSEQARQLAEYNQRLDEIERSNKEVVLRIEDVKKLIEKDECLDMAYGMLLHLGRLDPMQLAGLGKEFLKKLNMKTTAGERIGTESSA